MRTEESRRGPRFVFPLLTVAQLGSVLAVLVYVIAAGPTQSDAHVEFELRVLPFSPLLWLALAIVGIVALLVWRSGAWRPAARIGTWVSGLSGLLGIAVVAVGLQMLTSYGAGFDYPATPPQPAFATMVAKADGFDDDDPMRGREIVLDIGTHTESELVDFYREQFPASAGWMEGSPEVGGERDDYIVCLVSNAASGYDEYVEVYRYDGRFTNGLETGPSGGPNRFVVSISRLSVAEEWGSRTVNRCGEAAGWFPSDL